jgi:hypothetical protein
MRKPPRVAAPHLGRRAPLTGGRALSMVWNHVATIKFSVFRLLYNPLRHAALRAAELSPTNSYRAGQGEQRPLTPCP